MKKTLFFYLTLLLIALLYLPVWAQDKTHGPTAPTVVVIDMLDALAKEDEGEIVPRASFDTHGIDFYLITMQTAYADDRLTDGEVGVTCGFHTFEADAVVLVVRKTGANNKYFYEMYTYGDAYDIFSDRDVDRVLDEDAVYGNLKSGNVKDGATAFFALCAEEIDGHYEALAAKERRKPLTVVLVALGAGVLAGGGSVLGVWLYYRKKLHGVTYPLDRYAKLSLTHREDRFVGSHVTRVRVNNSSGGGSRGGGSRGGGFRGGR